MTTLHMPHLPEERPRFIGALSSLFWIVSLGLIAMWAFFLALGAFEPGEMVGVTVAIAGLLVLWVWHAWREHQRTVEGGRDPRLTHERERRGF